jgi:hypothetical protein
MANRVGFDLSNRGNFSLFSGLPYEICVQIFKKTSFKGVGFFTTTCKAAYKLILNSSYEDIFKSMLINAQNEIIHNYDQSLPDDRVHYVSYQMNQFLYSLHSFIVFPQPDGPLIPCMRDLFKNLKEKIQSDSNVLYSFNIVLTTFRQSLYKQPREVIGVNRLNECQLDQKFVYNLPLEWLGASTLVEVQERIRRCESGELQLQTFANECSDFLEKEIPSRKIFLKAISCQLLERIFQTDADQSYVNWFARHYLWYAFENLEEQDHSEALNKLAVWGIFYSNHWHQFRPCDLWEYTLRLFLLIMRCCNIKVDDLSNKDLKNYQFHSLVNIKTLLSWIPENVLLHIIEMTDKDTERRVRQFYTDWGGLSNKNEKIDLNTIKEVLAFLKMVVAAAFPKEITDILILKLCRKHRPLGYELVLGRGTRFKQNYQKLQSPQIAYQLCCFLLPAMFLLDDRSLTPLPEKKQLDLKKSLCACIPEEYDDPQKALGDSLLLIQKKVQELNFPPSFPCTVEELFAFLAKVRKEVSKTS